MAVNQGSVDRISQFLGKCNGVEVQQYVLPNVVEIFIFDDSDVLTWFQKCHEISMFLENNYKNMGFAQLSIHVESDDKLAAWFRLFTIEAIAR